MFCSRRDVSLNMLIPLNCMVFPYIHMSKPYTAYFPYMFIHIYSHVLSLTLPISQVGSMQTMPCTYWYYTECSVSVNIIFWKVYFIKCLYSYATITVLYWSDSWAVISSKAIQNMVVFSFNLLQNTNTWRGFRIFCGQWVFIFEYNATTKARWCIRI